MREVDGGFVPAEAWYEYHHAIAQAYVEVLLVRRKDEGYEFFLVRREPDIDFPGQPWHIPGGVWRTKDDIREGCNRVAARELKIPVRFVAEAGAYKWAGLMHHHGNGEATPRFPISHVCICVTDGNIPASVDGQWFSDIPENTIRQHAVFIRNAMQDITKGRPPVLIR